MKLDVNVLRYLTKDEFRVLTAVEMGQKNHEIVPVQLIDSISGLKHGGAHKCVKTLLRHKLLHHDSSAYDGYRLTWMGYDFLAIKVLLNRGHITGIGRQIGVGKESDIYEVTDDDGEVFALKLHRLGRTSFRAVKSKRDYLGKRQNYSWLYLSRLAALKEFAFMRALGEHGFPVPVAIDNSRHAVLMTLVDGKPLVQVRKLQNPGKAYITCMELLARLAAKGLVHCDFNEFNLLINEDDEELTVIDFPQMVSVSHANARELFERDVECILRFFRKKVGYEPTRDPTLPFIRPNFTTAMAAAAAAAAAAASVAAGGSGGSGTAVEGGTDGNGPQLGTLDVELAASGFKGKHQKVLEDWLLTDEAHTAGEGDERFEGDKLYGGGEDSDSEADAVGDFGTGVNTSSDDEDIREHGTAQAASTFPALDDSDLPTVSEQDGLAARTLTHDDDAVAEGAAGVSILEQVTAGVAARVQDINLQASSPLVLISDPDVGSSPNSSSSGEDEEGSVMTGPKEPRQKSSHLAGRAKQPIGEREAQQLIAAQKRAAVKRAVLARAGATRNSSKASGKGKSRGKGGGAAADAVWG